jgi:pSer/pThr/pTyr-binding forkhead associated (FHA) protein
VVPEAVIVVLRLVILVLLWGFVLAAVMAVRHDIFGGRRMTPAPPRPAPAAAASAPKRPSRPAPAATPAGLPRQLVVVEGPMAGHSVPLAGASITIGRSKDCTLTLSDDYASTQHARVSPRGDGWIVEDLGSTNGTFVGRTRVREATPLSPGTPLRLGRTVLELRP